MDDEQAKLAAAALDRIAEMVQLDLAHDAVNVVGWDGENVTVRRIPLHEYYSVETPTWPLIP